MRKQKARLRWLFYHFKVGAGAGYRPVHTKPYSDEMAPKPTAEPLAPSRTQQQLMPRLD
jgi:hypothetical protein